MNFLGTSVGGLYSFQQNMSLLSNGAHFLGGGIVGQQNPTESPIRHFSHTQQVYPVYKHAYTQSMIVCSY